MNVQWTKWKTILTRNNGMEKRQWGNTIFDSEKQKKLEKNAQKVIHLDDWFICLLETRITIFN